MVKFITMRQIQQNSSLLVRIVSLHNFNITCFTINSYICNKNDGGYYTIDNSLKWLEEEKIKAFAFKKIWKDDEKEPKKVIERLKEIAPKLLYYQCKTNCVKQ